MDSEQEDFFQEPEEEILNEEDLLRDDEEFPELDEETLEEMEKMSQREPGWSPIMPRI